MKQLLTLYDFVPIHPRVPIHPVLRYLNFVEKHFYVDFPMINSYQYIIVAILDAIKKKNRLCNRLMMFYFHSVMCYATYNKSVRKIRLC